MIYYIPMNTPSSLWVRPTLSSAIFFSKQPEEQLRELVALACCAPNSHNTQPWRFFIDPATGTITIAVHAGMILPESDPAGRQAVISVGCAIENILVAASAYGLHTRLSYISLDKQSLYKGHRGNKSIPLATITVRTSGSASACAAGDDASLLPCIRTRKMMRAEFDPARLISEEVMDLLRTQTFTDGVSLHIVTDTTRRFAIAEFQGQADNYVLNARRFARELGDWLLPNDTASHVGMPGTTFGLDDLQALRIHRGLIGEEKLEPEDMLRFSLGGKMGLEKSPALGFFTAPNDDIAAWLATGRALQRTFLILEREGISSAVHAAIVEVRLINRIFAASLGTLTPLCAVFRMGYPKDPSVKEARPHSPRLPLDEVLLKDQPIALS